MKGPLHKKGLRKKGKWPRGTEIGHGVWHGFMVTKSRKRGGEGKQEQKKKNVRPMVQKRNRMKIEIDTKPKEE